MKEVTYGEQRGQLAYEAYCKEAVKQDEEGLACHACTWQELDEGTKQCWIAAAEAIYVDLMQN